jgi:hypothetical protein
MDGGRKEQAMEIPALIVEPKKSNLAFSLHKTPCTRSLNTGVNLIIPILFRGKIINLVGVLSLDKTT